MFGGLEQVDDTVGPASALEDVDLNDSVMDKSSKYSKKAGLASKTQKKANVELTDDTEAPTPFNSGMYEGEKSKMSQWNRSRSICSESGSATTEKYQ